jgi:hypothetical protein
MSTARRWGRRALALAGGLLLAVFAAEGAARILAPPGHSDLLFDAPAASATGIYVTDPELVAVPRTDHRETVRSQGYAVDVAFDAHGVRTAMADSPPRDRRWIAAGDSFTLSLQVDFESTYEALLGDALGRSFLNAGVDGYSTPQAMGRAARLDRALGTEGVLLTFFLGNDLQDNVNVRNMRGAVSHLPPGSPLPRPPIGFWERFLARNSAVYAHYRVRENAARLATRRDPRWMRWRDELRLFTREGDNTLAQLLGPTREALSRALADTAARGDRLVVAVAPPAFVVHEDRREATFRLMDLDPARATPDAPAQAVLRLLAELGIPSCDLTPDLRAAAREGEAVYYRYDGHWTRAGHAVVARTLADCARSGGW